MPLGTRSFCPESVRKKFFSRPEDFLVVDVPRLAFLGLVVEQVHQQQPQRKAAAAVLPRYGHERPGVGEVFLIVRAVAPHLFCQ
jgi:hypothetical protein